MPIETRSTELGYSFEAWVINESMRISSYYDLDYGFSYYRTEKGAEIDLIIETPRGQMIAIEIKSSDSPSPVIGWKEFFL